MGIIHRGQISDLRGVTRLAVEATVGVTDLVEKMHHTIQLRHPPLGTSRAATTRGLTGFVYRCIRGTTRLVGQGLDAGFAPFAALLPEGSSNTTRDAVVSAINGVYGDHLVETGNPLAIGMDLRFGKHWLDSDHPDAFAGAMDQSGLTGKVMLFVHGLCLNDGHWVRDGHNHAEELAVDLGYTPLYLRYNSGLRIADNGLALAGLLERLLYGWPQPLSKLVIVGHSMGGLVARSACHQGQMTGNYWLKYLHAMAFLGTPHQGAPLERGGSWLDEALDLSPYAAPFTRIGRKRSAGISDLKHGNISGDPKEFSPLPDDVDCYAVAATVGKNRGQTPEQWIGDGLVPLDSALGRSKDPARTLVIPECHQWTATETGHIQLLGHPGVYRQLRDWLG